MDDYSFKTIKNSNVASGGADVASKNDYDAPTIKQNEVRIAGPKVGDKLVGGRYEILAELGRGGMGVVYRCFDSVSRIEVALKALPPELSHNSDEMEEVRSNFQLVSNLVHQNIAANRTLERDVLTCDYYLVMELVQGETLRQWMRRVRREKGTITIDEALPILRQVAEALDYAHARKVMHRDIKPSNIMLTDDGFVKVMDFGLAAQIHTSLSHVSMAYHGTSGTQSYMAPEQWRGMPQDAAADQYALAVMAYEILAGHLPFEASNNDVLKKAVLEEKPMMVDGLSSVANQAFQRALAKNASERFCSCSAFVASLTEVSPKSPASVAAQNISGAFEKTSSGDADVGGRQASKKSVKMSERQVQDVYVWQMELPNQKSAIEGENYDRGQTFGAHLDSLKRNLIAAEGIMRERDNEGRFELAYQWYKAAMGEVQWLKWNGPLREEACGLFPCVEEAEQKAKDEGAKIANGDFSVAAERLALARKSYEKGDFQNAIMALRTAKNGFERAFAEARADKISKLLEAGVAGFQSGRWDDAVKDADSVLTLEPNNVAAKKLRDDALALASRKHPADGENFKVELSDRDKIEMIWVSPGSFTMGSPSVEPGRYDDETQHNVCLTRGFWLGRHEVTHGQWKAVMGTDLRAQARKMLNDDTVYKFASGSKTLREWYGVSRDADPTTVLGNEDDQVAMHFVSYDDCLEFCRRLNESERAAGRLPAGYVYGLPTEAQWEYACRAGTATALYNGPIDIKGMYNAPALDDIAWYGGNSSVGFSGRGWDTAGLKEKQYPGGKASARNVGGKKPNPWGFYDMIGNVWEWCSDWYGSYNGDATDPKGPSNGSYRVFRGGGWDRDARLCRAACRDFNVPSFRYSYLGFRLALVPVQQEDRQANVEKGENSNANNDMSSPKQMQAAFPERLDLSGVPLKMIKVKAGMFQMGSPENELGRNDDEKQHWVTLTKDFWLGETEVTQGQWKAIMGDNPSNFKKGDNYPVEKVSWEDAMEFCDKLNEKYSGKLSSGYKFSLPTEAQWEYACRAGTTTALNNGKDLLDEKYNCPNLNEVGWYYYKSAERSTHPVGQKRRNAWGFFDMHGNVWEWCSDWYGSYNGDATDPKGPSSGSNRVRRGGCWGSGAGCCDAAYRGSNDPSHRSRGIGFRLALVPVQ